MMYAKLLSTATAVCRHAGRTAPSCATLRHHSIVTPQPRNYALPNPSWTRNTRELHDRFMRESGTWKPIPSYSENHHYSKDKPLKLEQQVRRRFTRNLDEDGLGFEYCLFYHKSEKRMVCIFQPGPYLEGYPRYIHGGCIATIIDVTLGKLAIHASGLAMTANLNISFRNPVLLGSSVLVDGRVDQVIGRKVYTSCQIRSHDDALLHAEATGLFIKVNGEDIEDASYHSYASSALTSSEDRLPLRPGRLAELRDKSSRSAES